MKKKIFYFFGSHAHPYYEKMMGTAPKEINYVSSIKVERIDHVKKQRSKIGMFTAEKIILPIFHYLGIPKIKYIRVSNDIDLIHSSQYLLWTNKPYVIDFEDVSSLTWYDYKILQKPHVKWLIRKVLMSKKCVGIMPWSYAAKKSLLNSISGLEKIEHKIKVVYPSYACIPAVIRSAHKDVTFLFVGKVFYEKGGEDAILAFDKLKKRLHIENSKINPKLWIVSNVPPEIREKYSSISGLKFFEVLKPEEVNDLYKKADVFVLPTHFDTFGFVYIEALAYGLPCIAMDNFAGPELITQGKTGFLAENFVSRFDKQSCVPIRNAVGIGSKKYIYDCAHPVEKTIDDISEAMYVLTVNKKLREKMSENARNEVVHGKFSISRRNSRLRSLYLIKKTKNL